MKIRKRYILAVFIITIITLFAFKTSERYFEIAKNLDIFATLFKEVNTYYVDEIDPDELIRTGIDAMLQSLDPYTTFIPEDEIEDYRTMTTGQYGGIGALIARIKEKTVITMPHKGYPAQKAGLMIGDIIVAIDGIDVTSKNTSEVSALLKGQSNTALELKIERYGVEKILTFHINRERITIKNVPYYGLLTDKVGYIKLQDFTTGAGSEVSHALINLKKDGATSIVLDLRGNPGGLLNEAVNVANIFIPKGSEVVSTKGKIQEWNKTYKALNSAVDTKIPLIVLTDSRSASAAEIVSGVIQDYDRGVLIGSKTFGKGLVQVTRPLTYNSQLKVTSAKYYVPSGRCIQAIDYSHKNDDGSADRIPDSLKISFKTKNGRKVFDGGGIDPDIVIKDENLAPITFALVTKGYMFDYATKFRFENSRIANPEKFKISTDQFQDFKSWLNKTDFEYATDIESSVSELEKTAKEEKYYSRIESQITDLHNNILKNKENDLTTFESEISEFLENEIVGRYYLEEGKIKSGLVTDLAVKRAIVTFNNLDSHKAILAHK